MILRPSEVTVEPHELDFYALPEMEIGPVTAEKFKGVTLKYAGFHSEPTPDIMKELVTLLKMFRCTPAFRTAGNEDGMRFIVGVSDGNDA